ncbi:unnamed protein product [Ectocarpus sp. 13 AM-2016]
MFVKTLAGKTHIIRAFPSETVLDIKDKSERAEDIPVDQQRLLYHGKQLEDDLTLRHYNIQNGSTLHRVLRLCGGKMVILLYPPAPVDTTVTLELSPLWSFSALRTVPEAPTVHASPDGSLEDLSTGREYPYLFWEADSSDGRLLIPLLTSAIPFGAVPYRLLRDRRSSTGVFLDRALERLGLNMRERCDMVTYWLPQLESSAFNVIYFVDVERYEKTARLSIAPAPDVTIRVFMAFR